MEGFTIVEYRWCRFVLKSVGLPEMAGEVAARVAEEERLRLRGLAENLAAEEVVRRQAGKDAESARLAALQAQRAGANSALGASSALSVLLL